MIKNRNRCNGKQKKEKTKINETKYWFFEKMILINL
jgi:hypothetical protein